MIKDATRLCMPLDIYIVLDVLNNKIERYEEYEDLKYYFHTAVGYDVLGDILFRAAREGFIAKNYRFISEDLDLLSIDILVPMSNVNTIDKDQAWTEVLIAYPKRMLINGKAVSLLITTMSSLSSYYYNTIIKGGNKKLHTAFINNVKLYYDNESDIVETGCKLQNFLFSYDSIKEELKAKQIKPSLAFNIRTA
jgi:hypothetical protein